VTVVDLHSHFFPEEWPDLAERFGTPDWPWMRRDDADHATVMMGNREFRPITSACWDPAVRLADMDRDGVDLQVVSDSQCGETNFGFDGPTGVCAAALLKDSCNGDSGGPLFWMNGATRIQIGIVSYGTSCALPEFPGVYSEVNNSHIRAFITTNAGV